MQIKAIQSFLFFLLRTYNLCRDFPAFADHYIYRKQIFAAAAALLANAKDLIDGEPFSIVLIVSTGTFLIMAMEFSPRSLTAMSCVGLENYVLNKEVVRMVTSGLGCLQGLDHDIRALHLRKFPPPGGERPSIMLMDRPDKGFGF